MFKRLGSDERFSHWTRPEREFPQNTLRRCWSVCVDAVAAVPRCKALGHV